MAGQYSIVEKGTPFSKEYRIYFAGPNGYVSPFHDIPLYASEDMTTVNMVVEVPRWTNAKMEISRDDKLNPIKQDIKKDKLRFVDNCFPHHGYIWNYGALPQTWEDPSFVDPNTNQKGDNDPVDVCEIGFKVRKRGDVFAVKVLGIMALIDEGETDWKVIAIDVEDPLAAQMNDIEDVEKLMPGFLKATNEWFRIYKIPTGKPENKFAFNGEAKNQHFALDIIKETHNQWRSAVLKPETSSSINCVNTTVKESPHCISQDEAQLIINEQPASTDPNSIPVEVDKWNFVSVKL